MLKVVFGLFCTSVGFASGLMMEVGPHDAATNLCSWSPFPSFCLELAPGWFEHWGWLLPTSLFIGGLILAAWAPIAAILHQWSIWNQTIPLSEAASHLYGELRGTDLGRFTEGHTGTSDEILDNVGMQILHNADVLVRRAPSPKWEIFPRSELSRMGVCHGATGIRYWGQEQAFYSDPKISKRNLHRVTKHLTQNANFIREWSSAPPQNNSDLRITLHDQPAYEAELLDADGNSLPVDFVFLIRLANGNKFLRQCQVFFGLPNDGPSHPVSGCFDLRRSEQKDIPVLRTKNTDDRRAIVYILRPSDWKISPQGPAWLPGPGLYEIKVLSADASPATLNVRLTKNENNWNLERA
jgi:hypothetical protein